jgi:hypothetical protein
VSSSDSPLTGAYIIPPLLVICAFSCELYLKCLISMEGNEPPTTHNLKKLFKCVRGKTQRELEAAWDADEATRNQLAKLGVMVGSKVPETLRDALSDGANAFDGLRYAYQQKDISQTNFLLNSFPRRYCKSGKGGNQL